MGARRRREMKTLNVFPYKDAKDQEPLNEPAERQERTV